MALKRADTCCRCASELTAGTRAKWDSTARTVTCLTCIDSSIDGGTEEQVASPAPAPASIDHGSAGASARREHERRRAKRDAQIEDKWGSGRIGRIAKALSDDPQTTKAWAAGADGEELVAKALHDGLGDRAMVLHDRKVPGTRGNIDHLVIAGSGVWIVDAKKFKGKVEQRDVGGWLRTDVRLYVGGRDRTKLVEGLGWQTDAVARALDGDESIPVHRALSFVGAEWPVFFAKPLRLDDVWISWPKKLAELILTSDQQLPDDRVETVARLLSVRLPAS